MIMGFSLPPIYDLNNMKHQSENSNLLDKNEPLVEPKLAHLKQLVNANTFRWKTIILLEAISLCLATPLAYLLLVFFLDNQWHLNVLGRLIASIGLFLGLGWAALHLYRQWNAIDLTEDQVALAIEQSTPGGVQNRLINALQLAQQNDQLNHAVVEENCLGLNQIHLAQATQMKPAAIRMAAAGGLLIVGIIFLIAKPDHFTNAASRIFLPFANIDPLYRTILTIEPGNFEALGEAQIQISIKGERPKKLVLFKNINGKRSSETIAVENNDEPVRHILRNLNENLDYAVRGNDFTSVYYHIEVPRISNLARIRMSYQYPAYTGEPEKTLESRSGDLEALEGTLAKVLFIFDRPVDSANLILEYKPEVKKSATTIPLKQVSQKEFEGDIVFDNLLGYRLETMQAGRPNLTTSFPIRILKDLEPKLELSGIERRSEVQLDTILHLKIKARDDYGIEKVGLFYRRINNSLSPSLATEENWQQIDIWNADQKKSFAINNFILPISKLQAAELDKFEIALQASDTEPARKGKWATGMIHELSIGGDGIALQIQYEQILRSEKDLTSLLLSEKEALKSTITWLGKLDNGELRWDDQKNIDALHAAIKILIKEQENVQKNTVMAARAMLLQTGNLRIALGMLADTEMLRLVRIYAAVPSRDKPTEKRAALADSRLAHERIIRSMEEMLEQYQNFRGEWEQSNMIAFLKMLVERQTKLRDLSRKLATSTEPRDETQTRASMNRRQIKILELCKLIQPAYLGVALRLQNLEPILAKAFNTAAKALDSSSILAPLTSAAEQANLGRWNETSQQQSLAVEQLSSLHNMLQMAQVEAASKALAALKAKLKSDLEAQKEIDKLAPGTAEAFLKDLPENIKVEDLMRIVEILGAKKRTDKNPAEEPDLLSIPMVDVDRNAIELKEDSGVRQDPYSLKLGNLAEKTPLLNLPKDQKENAVKPFIQEKFDDLVGKLLDETEELNKNFQSLKLSTNQNNNDPGEISKLGGKLNSTGAVSATGNKKPPTTEVGGMARTGRQGARATGMVADDEAVDRRGRDKALDGTMEAADQKGLIKMKKSDDMQKDVSTGVGGKKVESDNSHFSLHDSGKWKDDFIKRMDKPQKKQNIVERQGDKIDAKTAALLRDLTSQQEQVIEQLKSIRKELRSLYLPTEHLDELAAQLQSNLAVLSEQPSAELFNQQVHTLDKLRGAIRVFRYANSSLQPSLPRDRAIQGRILDQPQIQGFPEYEEAMRNYYLKLAEQ